MDKNLYNLLNSILKKDGLAGLIIIIFLALFAYQTYLLNEIVNTNRRKIELIEKDLIYFRLNDQALKEILKLV